ncbi:MAG TPA: hypothetical protein DCM40_25520 [Maribacter sp.]|mgnify:CR=1 FL=1|uniref:hypothetical protein n=1 Tax=Maribacter sp. UBA4516 TaxID=1946804 RepID=UPI000ED7A180|nr:hypothetical protein [Maribacter sp. UBA4516]HAI41226.1 hypothetical protein [Maribacter sp.]|tara:strand:+ start:91 stop:1002 length:912 start_codon:yes stop_codon:yes gene_type:complete
MHYLHKTLNAYNFFPHLSSLTNNPRNPPGLSDKVIRFLYRASCVFQSFHFIQQSHKDSIDLAFLYVKQLKFNESRRIAFSCTELFLAYSQIPSALSAMVIMQNELLRIIALISGGDGKNIPKSMNDAFKRGIEKLGYSNEVNKLITDYWNENGKYIRALRNINEHYDSLIDYTFFEFDKNQGKILILLPDNPESQSPRKFTYSNEHNAKDIIHNGIHALNNLVNKICELYKIETKKYQPILLSKKAENFNNIEDTTLSLMISVEQIVDGKKGLHAMHMMQTGFGVKGEPLIKWKPMQLDKDIE